MNHPFECSVVLIWRILKNSKGFEANSILLKSLSHLPSNSSHNNLQKTAQGRIKVQGNPPNHFLINPIPLIKEPIVI